MKNARFKDPACSRLRLGIARGWGGVTNFRAAARAIHDAPACTGILNALPAGPCRIIPQQEEVSIASSSPGSNEVNKICAYAETTAS
jgi:hypothetical protein